MVRIVPEYNVPHLMLLFRSKVGLSFILNDFHGHREKANHVTHIMNVYVYRLTRKLVELIDRK